MLSNNKKVITILLKIVVILSALVGTIISAMASADAFMGGHRVFMYFTIQSNLLIALVSLIGLCYILLKKEVNKILYVIKFVSTISITLTGFVFCFVLAPTMENSAWNLANILTHVIVPVAAIVDFFIVGDSTKYQKNDVWLVIIPPLLYAIYAGIGYALKWEFLPNTYYPYFFLNWGSKAGAFGFSNELPFVGVFWWIILLLLFLIGLGFLYLKILNVLNNKKIEE